MTTDSLLLICAATAPAARLAVLAYNAEGRRYLPRSGWVYIARAEALRGVERGSRVYVDPTLQVRHDYGEVIDQINERELLLFTSLREAMRHEEAAP